MRPHPVIVALALMLAGVIAFSSTLVIRHREARRLRRLPPPVLELPEPPPPRRWFPAPAAAAPVPAPKAAQPEPAPATGTLRIRVTGPHGLRLTPSEAHAVRQGDPEEKPAAFEPSEDEDVPAGTLVASGLEPGLYDIVVQEEGMRPARLEGVPTNGETVAIVLDRAPVLRGAVGRSREGGGACEGFVLLRVTQPKLLEGRTPVDRDDCAFAAEGPEAAGPVLALHVKGGRVVARALVTMPLAGDPPFLCLAPPCDEASSSLAVYVADTSGELLESASLEWTLVGNETRGELGNMTASGLTYLHGRRPGDTYHLRASVEDRAAETTVVVGSGVTDVVLTVPAPRM